MSNAALLLNIILWSWIVILNVNLKQDTVIAAVQDNGCTIPNEILDPILDKIVKERIE